VRIVIKIDGLEDLAGVVVEVSREGGRDQTSLRWPDEPASEREVAATDAGPAPAADSAVAGWALTPPAGASPPASPEPAATDAGPAPTSPNDGDRPV
jgi:hypothetical protein